MKLKWDELFVLLLHLLLVVVLVWNFQVGPPELRVAILILYGLTLGFLIAGYLRSKLQ